jgi:para-nitrobenzyl esterase
MHIDPSNPNTASSDLEISEIMATYWTNFAKHGHPNSEEVTEWPAFSEVNPVVMYLGPIAYLGPVPDEASLQVLNDYYTWRRTPEGKAWAK